MRGLPGSGTHIVLRGIDGAGRLARGAGRGVGLARRLGVAGGAQGRLEARVLGELCRDVDVIYANTIVATGPLLRVPPRLPAVLHLHEMGSSLRWLADGLADEAGLSSERYLEAVFGRVEAVVVPSEAVAADVAVLYPKAAPLLHTVPEILPSRPPGGDLPSARHELGIRDGTPLVVACGTVGWRKGTDLFLAVAAALRDTEAHFLWVGVPWAAAPGAPRRRAQLEFEWDVARSGLGRRVTAVPEVDDPTRYFVAADVLLLPSREDPYPIVALEAGAAGCPIVCFDSCGSAVWVRAGAGLVVPHLDLAGMAQAVRRLIDDEGLRGSLGDTARRLSHQSDVQLVGPRLLDLVDGARRGGLTGGSEGTAQP